VEASAHSNSLAAGTQAAPLPADDTAALLRDHATVDRAPVGIAQVAPDGSWLRVNDRMCEIVGYSREELLATTFQAVTHPEDLKADLAQAKRLLAGKIDRYQMEKRYVRRDGSERWVLLTVSLVRDPDTAEPLYFISVVEDIEARKRTEAALRASEERLAAVIDTAMDAIITADEDQHILSCNPAARRMFGYDEAEVAGQSLAMLMPERFRAAHANHVAQFGRSGETRRTREMFGMLTGRRKDGAEFPIEASVSRFHDSDGRTVYAAFVRDISERVRAESALRASERRFRALVEGVKEYALFMTDPQGVVLSWNSGVERVLGFSEGQIVGKHFRVIFTPADQEAGVPEQEMAAAEREGRAEGERWYVRRDGSQFFATSTVRPVRDEATGELLGFSQVIADATARSDYERRLAQKAALIDLASDAILVHEPVTNRITFWSRGAEELYGWSREEAVGQVAHELLRSEFFEVKGHGAVVEALLRDGRWEGDLAHLCKDGRRIVVASRWALLRDPWDEGASVALEVNRDMTDERRREAAQREEAARRREEAAQQRRIAETLQRSLLKSPPPDAFPGVTFKALYQSADDDALIGGDFFDVFAVEEDRIALVVGDATGNGLDAALNNAELRFALRALLREHAHPAAALARMNAFVAERDRLDPAHMGDSYLAMAVCVLHTRAGEVTCSWAGIEPPFVVRAGTGEVVELSECGGPLLGVEAGSHYAEQRTLLGAGDVLALSTDGLTETRRRRGRDWEFFGYGGLVRAVREEAVGTVSLAEAGLAVVERARAFAGGPVRDDVCLLLARRAPG